MMIDKPPEASGGGCLGTLVGGALGCILGVIIAYHQGLPPTGNPFLLVLDLLTYVCIGGGGLIGAIAGREIGTAVSRKLRSRRWESLVRREPAEKPEKETGTEPGPKTT
jgi:hypothetical protein